MLHLAAEGLHYATLVNLELTLVDHVLDEGAGGHVALRLLVLPGHLQLELPDAAQPEFDLLVSGGFSLLGLSHLGLVTLPYMTASYTQG